MADATQRVGAAALTEPALSKEISGTALTDAEEEPGYAAPTIREPIAVAVYETSILGASVP